MAFTSWLPGPLQPRRTIRKATRHTTRLAMEQMEDRLTPANILLIYDVISADTNSLKAALVGAGNTVTFSATAETGYNGTNPSPVAFDTVIHLDGTTHTTPMPLAGQTALVNFVQNGGRFIESEWSAYEQAGGGSGGMSAAFQNLVLFDRTGGTNIFSYSVVPAQAGNPILAGVPSSFTFSGAGNVGPVHVFATNPATVLMTDSNGSAAVAVRQFGSGSVVGFNHAGNYNAGTLSNANIQRLYINAVQATLSNTPPTVAINAATVSDNEGGTLSNTGTFSDPDGNATVTLTATVGGFAFGTITPNNANGTWSWSAPVDDGPAGPVTVTITATDNQNVSATTTFTYSVNNVNPTATLSTNSGISYGTAATASLGTPFDPSAADTTAGFHYAFSIDTDTTGTATYASSGTSNSANFGVLSAGVHTVCSRIIDKDNGSTVYSTTLTVIKANADFSSITGYSTSYDGNSHTATGSAIGVLGESLSGLDLSATTHTNAGTYTGDAWTFTDVTGNYNDASGTVDNAIAKAASTTTVTGAGGLYTGNPLPASAIATGAGGLSVTSPAGFTFIYTGTGDTAYGPSATPPKLAGTYTVTASYAGDANHTGSSSAAFPYTIAPRLLAVSRSESPTNNFIDWLKADGTLQWTIPVPTTNGATPVNFGAPNVAVTTDRDNDGYADLFIGSQAGRTNLVGLVSGKTGQLLWAGNAYVSTFTGGVTVASGDITGDGKQELVTGTASAGTPNVRAFEQGAGYTFSMIRDFYAYTISYTKGVNVAVADVNKDGVGDIITGTVAFSDNVRVFSKGLGTAMVADFYAFNRTGVIQGYAGGVTVAAGDVNGDGYADIVTGTVAQQSRVRVYSGANSGLGNVAGTLLQDFTTSTSNLGLQVMAADFGDGKTTVGTLTLNSSSIVLNTYGYNATLTPTSMLTKSYARPTGSQLQLRFG